MLKLLKILVLSALIIENKAEAEGEKENSNPNTRHQSDSQEQISSPAVSTLLDSPGENEKVEGEEGSDYEHHVVDDIKNCEEMAAAIENEVSTISHGYKIQSYYENFTNTVQDIAEKIMKSKEDANVFIKEKGISRVIVKNLKTSHKPLTKALLITLHNLFQTVPTTVKANTPLKTVDILLDIFENDDNLGLKAHVLDILYIWLPKRPRAQARVMIVKGLEPFYHQIPKLDVTVVNTLLDLFNIILEEHIKARNEIGETKQEVERLKLYKQIGLLEQINSPKICNGITMIFKEVWGYSVKDQAVLLPVYKLMKIIKPYCLERVKGQTNTMNLFERLLGFIKEPHQEKLFKKNKLNISEFISIAEEYVVMAKLQTKRDEL